MNRLMLIAIQSWNSWRAKRRLAKPTKPIIAENYQDIHEALGVRRSK